MATLVRGAAVVLLGIVLVGVVFVVAIVAALTDRGSAGVAGPLCVPAGADGGIAGLDDEQAANVVTILSTGARLGVPARAAVVAVATAMQESSLRNLVGGDRDSAGLFQQRPSQGWGTFEQITDPTTSATAFYRALLRIPAWEQLALTDAAQRVQRSAFPEAYAKWERLATTAVAEAGSRCVASTAALRPAADDGTTTPPVSDARDRVPTAAPSGLGPGHASASTHLAFAEV